MPRQDDTDDPLALDAQLCFAIYAAQLAMNKRYRGLLKKLGLTYPQYLVMLVLWERDRCTVSEIGARLALDSATLTPLLKRLEAAALVTRQRSRQDERRVDIALTELGHSLREQAEGIPYAIGCAGQCTPEETAELRDTLQRLRRRLDQE